MCLATITETYDPPLTEEQWAWGVFKRWWPGLVFQHRNWCGGEVCPRGDWLIAERLRIEIGDGEFFYLSGFHKFEHEEDACAYAEASGWSESLAVVPVKLRKIRMRGTQLLRGVFGPTAPCFVADEMYVPTEEELPAAIEAARKAAA